ncbi:MAG TPA: hypothetical protein VIV82_03490 [Verrucomicrobiae bacterium]|jgi:hypothetical protein
MKFATVLKSKFFFIALLVLGISGIAMADEVTALDLVKEANHHVGDEVKDKVVQLRSEKSLGSLTPNIWYVVYYDKDATFKTAEVKMGAGKKLEVKHPMRQPFAYIGYKNVLDLKKIKIDSDKAIKLATADPLLENLTVCATELSLNRDDNMPVWKVVLWAQKLRNKEKDAKIGEIRINAEDGTILDRDLHINRVD